MPTTKLDFAFILGGVFLAMFGQNRFNPTFRKKITFLRKKNKLRIFLAQSLIFWEKVLPKNISTGLLPLIEQTRVLNGLTSGMFVMFTTIICLLRSFPFVTVLSIETQATISKKMSSRSQF